MSKSSKISSDNSTSAPSGQRSGSGLGRAIWLLDLIVSEGPVRFAELVELTGIPKATLHRLLNELADERLIQLDERSQTWSSGYRILEMANRIWTRSDIRVLAQDQLLALNALSSETVQIGVQADTHVVIIDHVESSRSVRHSIIVGTRVPVYCTGMGKVLLAWCDDEQQRDIINRISFARFTPNTITDKQALLKELSDVSQRGYAVDAEERYLGSLCIAAPVVDSTGQAIAGLSITAPTFRTSEKTLDSWRDALISAAAEISRRLAPRTGPVNGVSH
ncbi:IclR family transcriptional regulator [Granulosicoccus sp. 3-233]|uniref:IclR family transcriptional regulator n=1 Tax=Granulosicoccus sp. 3-233 TaxID=3417969 RepID=UPI003D34B936